MAVTYIDNNNRKKIVPPVPQQRAGARRVGQDEANLALKIMSNRMNLSDLQCRDRMSSMPACRKILVVEDNPDAQLLVCELLGMLGYSAYGVADAEQAWVVLSEQAFDVLLTDISLPGMSGLALAARVLRVTPGMRIILSTGYGKETVNQISFPATILRKPYDLAELCSALEDPACLPSSTSAGDATAMLWRAATPPDS